MRVHRLDDGLVDLIAAGEVVERPASVVKELVENALDAGAAHVQVQTVDGGCSSIVVVDDGSGMSPEDAVLALERHATSKIASVSDLSRIATLGFRGEALPSIAAVSRLELTSRAEGSDGVRLMVEGGRRILQEKTGAPVGTRVQVADLFYNTPARRAFLKSPQAEGARLTEVLVRLALGRPDVAFDVASGQRRVLFTPGDGNLVTAAAQLLGLEVAEGLTPVDFAHAGIRVRGLVGRPTVARRSRAAQFFFANGRPTFHARLRYAAEEAYRGLMMKGSYPVLVLFLELDPEAFDPNVHPAKLEVRFKHESDVGSAVYRAVQEAVRPQAPVAPPWPREVGPASGPQASSEVAASAAGSSSSLPLPQEGLFLHDAPQPSGPSPRDSVPAELRPIAQVRRLYLLAEGPDGIYLIDQHAAHERVLFDRLRTQPELTAQQALMVPLVVTLPPQAREHLGAFSEELAAMGFAFDRLASEGDLIVRGLPTFFGRRCRAADMVSLVEELAAGAKDPRGRREHVMMAMAACRAAIKREDLLDLAEQKALIVQLLSTEEPRRCPHGRPTYLRLSFDELEARFERR